MRAFEPRLVLVRLFSGTGFAADVCVDVDGVLVRIKTTTLGTRDPVSGFQLVFVLEVGVDEVLDFCAEAGLTKGALYAVVSEIFWQNENDNIHEVKSETITI